MCRLKYLRRLNVRPVSLISLVRVVAVGALALAAEIESSEVLGDGAGTAIVSELPNSTKVVAALVSGAVIGAAVGPVALASVADRDHGSKAEESKLEELHVEFGVDEGLVW